jgi:hypothetical protein
MKKYFILLLLLVFIMGLSGCNYVRPVNIKNGLFSDGLVSVKKNGKYGFVNNKGRTVIDFEYDEAGRFVKGFAVVKKNNEYSLIDSLGNIILPEVTFDYLVMDNETGLIWFRKDGKIGLLNNQGQKVVDNLYIIRQ